MEVTNLHFRFLIASVVISIDVDRGCHIDHVDILVYNVLDMTASPVRPLDLSAMHRVDGSPVDPANIVDAE